jgi:hypothetical protein
MHYEPFEPFETTEPTWAERAELPSDRAYDLVARVLAAAVRRERLARPDCIEVVARLLHAVVTATDEDFAIPEQSDCDDS